MKKNILNIIIIASTIIVGFSFLANNVYAGCCVNGNTCINATVASDCSGGASFNAVNCSTINSCNPSTEETTTFKNPLGSVTTVSQLLSSILNNLMGIIVFISVIFIIIGGIMYMMSGGNEAMVTRAKKTWTGAVIGLAIALAAPTFLKEIQNILGGGGTGGNADAWVSNALTLKEIAINILNLLLSILGIVGMISLVVGGGMYLTAYGDERRIDSAKKIVTYAIIGIVVALAALVIVRQVDSLLRSGTPPAPVGGTTVVINR